MAVAFWCKATGQTYYSIKAESINTYISCENATKPITATRPGPGEWELFEKVPSGSLFGFKSKQNSAYISDENGGLMTCNRPQSSFGAWEKFTLVSLGSNTYAIRDHNGKYMTHSQGNGTQLICNSNTIGTNQRFIIEQEDECSSQSWNPAPNWKDSYQANGFCWCDTTFDHDLDNIDSVSFVINGLKRNIRTICDELKLHPNYRAFLNGDPIFNDIQCGNGPANTALDEKCCPGRTDLTPGSSGCQITGAGWDIAWLESRAVFGGGSTTFPDPNKTYYMDAPHHNRRIAANGSSEDPYTTSTNTTGSNVEWKFVARGNYWHIQRAAGGTKPRLRTDNSDLADMQPTSSSGTYTYYQLTPGYIAGTYFLTLPNGPSNHKRLQLHSNGDIKFVPTSHVGTWESFRFTEASSSNKKVDSKLTETLLNNDKVSVFPNPVSGNILNIRTQLANEAQSTVSIMNFLGQTVYNKDLGTLNSGTANISIDNIKSFAKSKGLYFVIVKIADKKFTHKIMMN